MNRRGLVGLALAIVAAMLLSGMWVGSRLPADALLPVHWNAAGRPDRLAGKWIALALPALLTLAVTCVAALLPRLEPMRDNLARSGGLFRTVWLAWLGVATVLHLMLLDAALGWGVVGPRWLLAAIGASLVLIGNCLGKSRRMYMIGIRTPWTLADEDVWIATHRLGGKLMVATGLLWCALAALAPLTSAVTTLMMITTLLLAIVAPLVYSYVLWRKRHPVAA